MNSQRENGDDGKHSSELTYAGRGVRLPEETVVELNTGNLRHSLDLVARITLKRNRISWFSAVPIAGTILGDAWVVAGGGCCS